MLMKSAQPISIARFVRFSRENENRLDQPWTVILNEVKDLLFAFAHFETKDKQILRRRVYPEHGRRAPQNDIGTLFATKCKMSLELMCHFDEARSLSWHIPLH